MLQKLLHKLCFKNCFTKYASKTASQSMLQKTACQQCLHHSSSCVFSHLQQHLLDCKTTNASKLLHPWCFKNCLTYHASKNATHIMLQKLLQKWCIENCRPNTYTACAISAGVRKPTAKCNSFMFASTLTNNSCNASSNLHCKFCLRVESKLHQILKPDYNVCKNTYKLQLPTFLHSHLQISSCVFRTHCNHHFCTSLQCKWSTLWSFMFYIYILIRPPSGW